MIEAGRGFVEDGLGPKRDYVTSEVLRNLQLVDVERILNEGPHGDWERGELGIGREELDGPDPARELRAHFETSTAKDEWAADDSRRYRLRTLPTVGLTDDYLRRVARAYRSAIDAGERAPAVVLMEDSGAPSLRTVRSWIAKARVRGLLPPGRAGYLG